MRKPVKILQKLKKWPILLRPESIQQPISSIVPVGCLPIYVGNEGSRFIVGTH